MENLRRGKHASYVRRSDYLLLFFAEGVSVSKTCKAEILAARHQRKPIILVRETDEERGADTFASLRKRRHAIDAPFVAVHNSVMGGETKADRERREDGRPPSADALGRMLAAAAYDGDDEGDAAAAAAAEVGAGDAGTR